jgi:hypothetical protein
MKIYFTNYRSHWLSPYTILEKVIFWRKIDYDEPMIEKWSDRLLPFCKAWGKFLDFVHPEIKYVKIDRYDTWNMDSTLARIILPMLKQLKDNKHGSPSVDDEDVPEELKSTNASPKENEWDTDENWFKRWDWVLDEIIWTFEQKQSGKDWMDQYTSGETDYISVPVDEDGNEVVDKKDTKYFTLRKGPNHTYVMDHEGITAHQNRMNNGFRLFGKYYESLWD